MAMMHSSTSIDGDKRVGSASEDGPSLADFLPDTSSGFKAVAGEPHNRAETDAVAKARIIDACMTVQDPEIPVNIYDLGLIYDIISHTGGNISITMSLTAPGCPVAGELPMQVAQAVAALEEAGQVDVTLVWEPAWTPDRMSEDAKMALDFD